MFILRPLLFNPYMFPLAHVIIHKQQLYKIILPDEYASHTSTEEEAH